jgi:hypothetical protein
MNKMTEVLDFSQLMAGGLFSETAKKLGNTVVILKKAEERRKNLNGSSKGLAYKTYPLHLFPSHHKAPYIREEGEAGTIAARIYGRDGANTQYTANFILEYDFDKNGKKLCSEESLVDRVYIALMARQKLNFKDDEKTLFEAQKVIEDIIVPSITKRYAYLDGWNEEYVRLGVLRACVDAMAEAFTKRPSLLKMYEKLILNGNGKKK